MTKYGIPCPYVIALKKHVLAMSLIGTPEKPAPNLMDAKLSTAEAELCYYQCVEVRIYKIFSFKISIF